MIKSSVNSPSYLFILALALIIFAARLILIQTYASSTPYWDDWGMGAIILKYATGEFTWSDLFITHNEHRFLFSKLANLFLFDANGNQWDVRLIMVFNAFVATCCATLLLLVAKASARDCNAWALSFFIVLLWAYPVSLVSILWAMQTHTYFMILFVIAGLWFIHNQVFSIKWWIGVVSLFCATLTLAGGVFAATSVTGVLSLNLYLVKKNKKQLLVSFFASIVVAIYGLIYIVQQSDQSSISRPEHFIDGVQTFLKSMSWPIHIEIWPSLIFNLPCLVLIALVLARKLEFKRTTSFTIALFTFGVTTALAIAYARGIHGIAPPRRYLEFLALTFYANVMALSILLSANELFNRRTKQAFFLIWGLTLIYSSKHQSDVLRFTLDDRNSVLTEQFLNVRNYLLTKDDEHLHDKPFRHIPFHRGDYLKDFLDRASDLNILHYDFQVQTLTDDLVGQEAFVVDGTSSPCGNSNILTCSGEMVIGSYDLTKGGVEATGVYVSPIMVANRHYMLIPITGHLGYPGLRLSIKELGSDEMISIEPREKSSKYAELWRPVWIKAPDKAFQIIAEDHNPEYWFGFALPKSVGKLSYFADQTLKQAGDLIILAFFLMFFPTLLNGFKTKRASPIDG